MTSEVAPAASGNARGIMAMVLSQASFIVNDALIKLAAETLPTGQSIFLRGVAATAMILAALALTGGLREARTALAHPGVRLRSLAEIGSTYLYLGALFHMAIADATAIIQFAPLALTAGAALFLGEPVGWRRWAATLVGLVGVLLIIKPGSAGFNIWSLVALLSVGFMVGRDLITRRIDRSIPTLAVTLAGSLVVTAFGLFFLPFETWVVPSARTLALLTGAAVFLIGGYYFIIEAMRHGEVAVVSPFRYSVIVFALVAGWFIWRETPDALAVTGLVVVLAAGLYTFHRERVVGRGPLAGRTPGAGATREPARRS
jgi:drug/metabolite transporter (DMT)-like permease